jgi:hypothetical protein
MFSEGTGNGCGPHDILAGSEVQHVDRRRHEAFSLFRQSERTDQFIIQDGTTKQTELGFLQLCRTDSLRRNETPIASEDKLADTSPLDKRGMIRES